MSIILPHDFKDGVDEVASGVQVMGNLNVLKTHLEALEAAVGRLASAQAFATGALAPPTNAHQAIPGLSIATPALLPSDVLIVYFAAAIFPSNNEILATLTINGAEQNRAQVSHSSTSVDATSPVASCTRFTGLTGAQTLAANGWATAAVGQIAGASILYEILSA